MSAVRGFQSFQKRRKRFKVRRTHYQSILNKMKKIKPLPRVFPFYCEICTLSSRFTHVIRDHACSKRNESKHVLSFENEVRIVTIGAISKSKDAQAVMERIPNPQRIDFKVPIRVSHELKFRAEYGVPSLVNLCMRITGLSEIEKVIPTDDVFDPLPVKQNIFKDRTSRLGYICTACKNMFPTYSDFDEHLTETDCHSKADAEVLEPIEIAMNMDRVPGYGYGCRALKTFDEPKQLRICSGCHCDSFKNDEAFHNHIFECAKFIYNPKHL
ncbi:unnamed protein product [Auanema sp. JU1783]|nr:unnamed protein product [Auanema sp. JU1783]